LGTLHCKPEILNTDQKTQFASTAFTQILNDRGVSISMDGRSRCQDNIFVERLQWTLKHNYLYLYSFSTGSEMHREPIEWVRFIQPGTRPLLATGRFIGQGLAADRKCIHETLFDLHVSQPEDRMHWR
jgi:transposase InsO family protein